MVGLLLLAVSPARHTLGSILYAESVTGETAIDAIDVVDVVGRWPSGFG